MTPTTVGEPEIDWEAIHLSHSSHSTRLDGVCLLEAVAWLAGEDHSDHPECVSPVLAAFGRRWNDNLPDDDRDRLLKPFGPRLVNTRASDEVEERRSWMALDWLIRTHVPAWLDLAGLDDHATALREAGEVVDAESLVVMGVMRPARDAADAAWAAAWDAAGAAAWDAAGAAARDVARDVARAAAWDAAGAAARDVARDVARAAARDVLQPTVGRLQDSAVDLFDRMIRVGEAA